MSIFARFDEVIPPADQAHHDKLSIKSTRPEPVEGQRTIKDVFSRYLDYLRARNVSPYTVRNYDHDICEFLQFHKSRGVISLKEVRRPDVRDYINRLMEQGIVKRSISRRLSAIRSFYRYLRRENLITAEELPLSISGKRGSKLPDFAIKLEQRLPDILTVDQTKKLMAMPDTAKPSGERDRAIIELLYASGLRVSELAALRLGDIDLANREIRVQAGKGQKDRMVLMGKPAAAALQTYLDNGRTRLMGRRSGSAVFLNTRGGRFTVRSVQRILHKYGLSIGTKKPVHPHMLRHSFATHMLDKGADLRVVQELLGHKDLSSTEKYLEVSKSRVKKVYQAAHPLAREPQDGL